MTGRTVQLWVDTAGWPTGPPPRYGAPVASEALVAVLATAAATGRGGGLAA